MIYQQNIENCFDSKIGDKGINKNSYKNNLKKANDFLAKLAEDKSSGNFPIANHLEQSDDIDQIIEIGQEIVENFDELLVLGTGGSTLNPQSLVSLKQPHQGIDKKVYFIDSCDSHTITSFINQIDFEHTAILVTSKSGETLETISQLLIFIEEFENRKLNPAKHIYILTGDTNNSIKNIAQKIGAKILHHEHDIGGRFSIFTNVGLIPAYVAGINIKKIRSSATQHLSDLLHKDSVVAEGAALQYSFMQQNMNINVMMPYIERLSPFVSWYRQIWAESLGKNGKGSTIIKAIGSLDQHSQLQLYLDGPKDKIFTLISCTEQYNKSIISNKYLDKHSIYLQGKNIDDVSSALQRATIEALINNECPLRQITIGNLDEAMLSKLIAHFMLETIVTANLLQANPFDQPAVEHIKKAAIDLL